MLFSYFGDGVSCLPCVRRSLRKEKAHQKYAWKQHSINRHGNPWYQWHNHLKSKKLSAYLVCFLSNVWFILRSHCCGHDAGTAGADGYRAWCNRPAEYWKHCKRPARHFRGLKPVKRQPWTPIRSHCCGRGDGGTVCLRSWALCMREWRVLGSVQANGRLQRWNSKGWRLQGWVQPGGGVLEALQTAGEAF